jgi:hypothetical protein
MGTFLFWFTRGAHSCKPDLGNYQLIKKIVILVGWWISSLVDKLVFQLKYVYTQNNDYVIVVINLYSI